MKKSILKSVHANGTFAILQGFATYVLLALCFIFFISPVKAMAVDPPVLRKVQIMESTITWTGKKVTGQHVGTIAIKDGDLSFGDNGQLEAGQFLIDMNSIACTDLSGGAAKKLEGHLKSDDFFGVKSFPTADLKITKVIALGDGLYEVIADVTIKEITNSVNFKATINGDQVHAKIVIDRSKYNVRYGSGSFFENLGDRTIYDEFELEVMLIVK